MHSNKKQMALCLQRGSYFHSLLKIRHLSLCFIAFLLFSSHHAQAANIELAVKNYRKGYNLFFKKDYREALSFFQNSLKSLPKVKRYRRAQTALLFFTGSSHHNLGEKEAAINYLKQFLKATQKLRQENGGNLPSKTLTREKKARAIIKKLSGEAKPKESKKPQGSIKKEPKRNSPLVRKKREKPIQRKIKVLPRSKKQPTPRTRRLSKVTKRRPFQRPKPKPQSTSPHPLGWVLAGIGLAAIGGAVITGVLAQKKAEESGQQYSAQRINGKNAQSVSVPFAEAQRQGNIANILYIAGGVLLGTGSILLVTWHVPSSQE